MNPVSGRNLEGISLVIPVRNEALTLHALLESIRQQIRPPNEVILVDGGSTDGTAALAAELTAGDKRFRIVRAGPATPGRGRNVGIQVAAHEWIALTDAGIRLEPTWLQHLERTLEHSPRPQIVYGNFEPCRGSFFEHCAAMAYVSPSQLVRGARIRGRFIASSLLHRSVWESVGGFPDLRAAEDLIFMERVEQSGCAIGWAPEATVWWQLQPTFRGTFSRFCNYSRHNVWAGRQHLWHHGILRKYLLALPFLLLAVPSSPWWLFAPPAGLLARSLRSRWRWRQDRPLRVLRFPAEVLLIALILLAIDAATMIGWIQALSSPRSASVELTTPGVRSRPT